MSDQGARQLYVMSLLPVEPQSLSTEQIHDLINDDFPCSERTLQRDLSSLSRYNVVNLETGGWAFDKTTGSVFAMSPLEALSIVLGFEHLKTLIPQSKVDRGSSILARAHDVLDSAKKSGYARWPDKVKVTPPGPQLVPPAIDQKVLETIYDALLKDRLIHIKYKPMKQGTKQHKNVFPLALVQRGNKVYLICRFEGEDESRSLPLHRFKSAEISRSTLTPPREFDFDKFIANGHFPWSHPGDADIKLELKIDDREMRYLFEETPLSKDQTISAPRNGYSTVKATVKETMDLKHWLWGIGPDIELVKPKALRDFFKEKAQGMQDIYK